MTSIQLAEYFFFRPSSLLDRVIYVRNLIKNHRKTQIPGVTYRATTRYHLELRELEEEAAIKIQRMWRKTIGVVDM